MVNQRGKRRFIRRVTAVSVALLLAAVAPATAQTAGAPVAPQGPPPPVAAPAGGVATPAPPAAAAPAAPPATTPTAPPAPPAAPAPKSPDGSASPPAPPVPPATPEGVPLAPHGKPQRNEIEPNASPTVPENATTENVEVPARPVIAATGQSSYDEAFKSIKASLDAVRKAMDKAGLKPSGHPITIFSAPDDKGFRYQAGVPVAKAPEKTDFGGGVALVTSPAGKAIKFQHRGAYDDIDATYDVITAFLDAKGLQVDSPYIEEYLTDLTTPDDPNLQVDIYVFVK